MIDSWKASGLAAMALVVAIAIGVGLQAWSLGSTRTASITVWQGGSNPTVFSSESAGLAYASSLAGFNVMAPAYLPPGFALTEVDVGDGDTIGPSACLGFVGAPITPVIPSPGATQNYCAGDRLSLVLIAVPGRPIDVGGPLIATPAAGVTVFKLAPGQYELVSRTRTIDLETRGLSLRDADAVAILGSIAIPTDIP